MSNRRRLLEVFLLAFRPARWSVFGYRFVPLLLLAGGIWAVAYGGFYHRIPVSEMHEEQITIKEPVPGWMPPPMPPSVPPDGSPDGPPGSTPIPPTDAFGQPADAAGPPPEAFVPPVRIIHAVQTSKTTSEEREFVVNRAVTVAGMMRDQEGEIFRVSAAGGPAFCPS